MKYFLAFIVLIGSNVFAATCPLGEARQALRASLQTKLHDGKYDGVADFCIQNPQQIEKSVMSLTKTTRTLGVVITKLSCANSIAAPTICLRLFSPMSTATAPLLNTIATIKIKIKSPER